MVRRDYQLLTEQFKIFIKDCEDDEVALLVEFAESLAIGLNEDNKAFDKDKFINDIRGL